MGLFSTKPEKKLYSLINSIVDTYPETELSLRKENSKLELKILIAALIIKILSKDSQVNIQDIRDKLVQEIDYHIQAFNKSRYGIANHWDFMKSRFVFYYGEISQIEKDENYLLSKVTYLVSVNPLDYSIKDCTDLSKILFISMFLNNIKDLIKEEIIKILKK